VDWQQVIVLALVVVDGLFVLSALKSRSPKVAQTP
jgi:hypothetical protein